MIHREVADCLIKRLAPSAISSIVYGRYGDDPGYFSARAMLVVTWNASDGGLVHANVICHPYAVEVSVWVGERSPRHADFCYSDPSFPESALAMILGCSGKRFVPRSAV